MSDLSTHRSYRPAQASFCQPLVRAMFILVLFALPFDAAAQVRDAALARIRLLNQQAMTDYDGLEFASSRRRLLEALSIAQGASITTGPELVQTYLNLAVLHGTALNDRTQAVDYLTTALRLDPNTQLDPARATPQLEGMFDLARRNLGRQAADKRSVEHSPPVSVRAETAVTVRGRVSPALFGARALLFYRSGDAARFVGVPMTRYRGGVRIGTIPAPSVTGRAIHYYIDIQGPNGSSLARSGSPASPHVVGIEGRSTSAPTEFSRSVDISVTVGVGVGVVFGGTSENAHPRVATTALETVDIKPGGALAPLHLGADIGYYITPHWQISGLLRLQLVNALNADDANRTLESPISVLGQLRAKRFFGDDNSRFYFAFGAGGGQIRHRIPLGDYDSTEDPTGTLTPNAVVDARVAGVAAFALGAGYQLMVAEHFGFLFEINGLLLIPDFAAHADLNIGVLTTF